MKILLLGCGNVGANVARQLVAGNPDVEYVIADINADTATALATEVGSVARAMRVDINQPQQLDAALDGVQLVFNAVGPFYRSALPVVEAALRNRVDYIDINDDHDVAEALLLKGDYHARALAAGIRIIIGCGSTPGLTNVVARLLADRLDQTHAIHLSTVVPFSPQSLSPAVVDHMLHITSGGVTQFEQGQYCLKLGWSGRRDVEYKAPFGEMGAYLIGHGETITLPHYIKGVQEVSNRIGFFPDRGNQIWRSFIDLGFAATDKIEGLGISPRQFMAQYFSSSVAAEALTVDLSTAPRSVAFRIEVLGQRDDAEITSVMEYHIKLPTSAEEAGSADPTPTCARLVLEAYIRGEITGQGLLSPEICLDAEAYVAAFAEATGANFILDERVVKGGLYTS